MSYRFMRIIVFFDLPTETNENKREYRRFRKMLIENGFFMLQESVYCRMALNQTTAGMIVNTIKANKPPIGLVQMLTITEKQFSKMEMVSGEFSSDVIDDDKRLVIL